MVARLLDDLEQIGTLAEPAVVAERRPQADALAAQVLADQLRGERQLLAERNGWRLRKQRLHVASHWAVPDVAEHDVAVGVLLDVEQL